MNDQDKNRQQQQGGQGQQDRDRQQQQQQGGQGQQDRDRQQGGQGQEFERENPQQR